MTALKTLQYFSYIESGVTVLIVVLIANIKLFGKYIIFNLADLSKTYSREEARLADEQNHALKLLIFAKKFF